MRFTISQLNGFTCTILPTVLSSIYFVVTLTSANYIPDQQIPLCFIIVSVKSAPCTSMSFKPFHLKVF